MKNCIHYSDNYASCNISSKKCGEQRNCYYKQLQAEKEKAIKYLQMYYKAKAGLS